MAEKLKPYEMRRFYAYVMIIMPSILLVIVSMSMDNLLGRVLAQIILFVLQVLAVKGIVDDAIN
jgi:hypothetical protein